MSPGCHLCYCEQSHDLRAALSCRMVNLRWCEVFVSPESRFVESRGVCDFRVWEHDALSLIRRALEQTVLWFRCFWSRSAMTPHLVSGCLELRTVFPYGWVCFNCCLPELRKRWRFCSVLLWCRARAVASVHLQPSLFIFVSCLVIKFLIKFLELCLCLLSWIWATNVHF